MNAPPSPSAAIPLLTSIAEVALPARAWLVDIWGVMHNGVAPFRSAVAATEAFRAQGGIVLLVSNAPRPDSSVAEQIERIGVPRAAYDAIVSSGDVCRAMLAEAAGQPLHHVGPERDRPLFAGLPLRFVAEEEAALVVCTGLFDDTRETAEDYRGLLERLRARQVPMLCANPDLTVERGDRLVYCAGAIAELYETLGGTVAYAGKPHLPIYDMALARLASIAGGPVRREEILAIGDGLRTDIAGAARAGIRSVFIASGVHIAGGRLDAGALDRLFADSAARPIAAMQALAP